MYIQARNRSALMNLAYSIRVNQSGMGSQVMHALAKMLLKKYKYIGIPQGVTYYVSLERKDYQNFMDSAVEKVYEKSKLQKKVNICINLQNLAMMFRRTDIFAQTRVTFRIISRQGCLTSLLRWELVYGDTFV